MAVVLKVSWELCNLHRSEFQLQVIGILCRFNGKHIAGLLELHF